MRPPSRRSAAYAGGVLRAAPRILDCVTRPHPASVVFSEAESRPHESSRYPFLWSANVIRTEEISVPIPQPDEVLVKVRAASVNPVVYKIRSGHNPLVKQVP